MEDFITVQKGTKDEWNIGYTLEGNISSNNLVVMVHGGGYDRDENGFYPCIENGTVKRDENGKAIFIKKPYGNYQRLSYELQANDIDTAILRIDLRNHGKSLVNGKMDERDTSFVRFANDLDSVIKQIKSKYGYQNIHIVGTCAGALTTTYYIANKKDKEDIKSLTLISPLSPNALCTTNPNHGFNYKKNMLLLNGKIKQFTKMHGMFEGIKTIREARNNMNIYEKLNNGIPICYIASPTDRIIPYDISLDIINKLSNYDNFKPIILYDKEIRGNADHCFYDPQSSDRLLMVCTEFLSEQITKNKSYRLVI